jgi:hypothetical protein
MSWPGKVSIRGHEGGRHGRPVMLGTTLVPPVATFEVSGSGGAPDALVRFEIRDGRPECTEITVKASPSGRGIRSADMGLFNIDNLVTNVFAELGRRLRPNPAAPWEHIADYPVTDERERWSIKGDVATARTATRRGRPSAEELERVAEIYREHVGGAPTQAVAALLGVSWRTAARRVQQARDAGLLPATTQGKKKG